MALLTSSFLRVSPKPSASPWELSVEDLYEFWGSPRTTAEAQDLDVVPKRRIGQTDHGGRKEHGLVVGMRDEEAYPLVADRGERTAQLRRVDP